MFHIASYICYVKHLSARLGSKIGVALVYAVIPLYATSFVTVILTDTVLNTLCKPSIVREELNLSKQIAYT